MMTDMTNINFAISKYCSIEKEQESLVRNLQDKKFLFLLVGDDTAIVGVLALIAALNEIINSCDTTS